MRPLAEPAHDSAHAYRGRRKAHKAVVVVLQSRQAAKAVLRTTWKLVCLQTPLHGVADGVADNLMLCTVLMARHSAQSCAASILIKSWTAAAYSAACHRRCSTCGESPKSCRWVSTPRSACTVDDLSKSEIHGHCPEATFKQAAYTQRYSCSTCALAKASTCFAGISASALENRYSCGERGAESCHRCQSCDASEHTVWFCVMKCNAPSR